MESSGGAVPIRRKLLILGLTAGFALAAAPAAFAANNVPQVNLTMFGTVVSGTAPSTASGFAGVTVYLLRNTRNPTTGVVTLNVVDTFAATPSATTGLWTGSFAAHRFAGGLDEVEIVYSGTPLPAPPTVADPTPTAPTQVTILGNSSLAVPSASSPPGAIEIFPRSIDGNYSIDPTGATLTCLSSNCSEVSSVNGATPVAGVATDTLALSPAAVNTKATPITTSVTDFNSETVVTLTGSLPLLSLSIPVAGAPAGFPPDTQTVSSAPVCTAYLVTTEVVCTGLTPGSYTLTDGTSTQTITVPAASPATYQGNGLFVPSEAGASIPGLAGGQTVILSDGSNVLTTLKVASLKIASITPLGDLLTGRSITTETGTCTAGVYFFSNGGPSSPDLCTPSALFPAPHSTGDFGQLNEGGFGNTQVDLPFITQASLGGGSVYSPFIVTAFPRYVDHLVQVAADNTRTPSVGQAPVVPSSASGLPVVFSYAPLGSSSFTPLGNINVAGGLPLPTLAKGSYVGRYTLTDARGDSISSDVQFYDQGSATPPTTAPTAPACSAKGSRITATFKSVRATAAKAKKKKKAKAASVTIRCTSSVAGARLAVWLQRGSNTVADGSGVFKGGNVKIVLTGGIKKGNYQLIETIIAGGQATEASHVLNLK
jgi:hypothetical protein